MAQSKRYLIVFVLRGDEIAGIQAIKIFLFRITIYGYTFQERNVNAKIALATLPGFLMLSILKLILLQAL